MPAVVRLPMWFGMGRYHRIALTAEHSRALPERQCRRSNQQIRHWDGTLTCFAPSLHQK